MSDNKIVDTLEFDDDIDFEGLDEYEDSVEHELDAGCDIVDEDDIDADGQAAYESIDSEADVHDDSDRSSEPEYYSPDFNNTIDSEKIIEVESDSGLQGVVDNIEIKNNDKFIRRMCVINTVVAVVTLCLLCGGIFLGSQYISSIKSELDVKSAEINELENKNKTLESDYMAAMNSLDEEEISDKESITENEIEQGKIIFYDPSVGYAWLPVLSGIKQNTYDFNSFSVDDRYRMSYNVDGEESSYFGIDVSSYQGDIDWQLVKEDGVEFAFLRIGFRGYGEEGKLCPDEYFVQNYEGAHDAGIDLGVYFFSQATSVAEAVEEAEFVLSLLENRTLEYPIVFDWENIFTGDPEDIPRTDDMMPQTLTLSAIAFCETVKDAGYEAMIYTNKKLATIKYDLRQLSDYPVWLAYYDTELDYYYDFDIWQYGTGQVDGIEGEVDVNIAIIK